MKNNGFVIPFAFLSRLKDLPMDLVVNHDFPLLPEKKKAPILHYEDRGSSCQDPTNSTSVTFSSASTT